MKRAFTLIELLVVIAIIAVLSAILLPVFLQAKAGARKSACINNFKQVNAAHLMYSNEYDDVVVPAAYRFDVLADPLNDRKWPQLLHPYVRSFAVFQCPVDTTERPKTESVFSADLSLADPVARYYLLAQRTNFGYNEPYLSPIVQEGSDLVARPVSKSSVSEPANTIEFVDSVFKANNGQTSGGGRYVIDPPCRYAMIDGVRRDTMMGDVPDRVTIRGWDDLTGLSSLTYGGAWPWHGKSATIGYLDGHVSSPDIRKLTQGCEVKPRWSGTIVDLEVYPWNVR